MSAISPADRGSEREPLLNHRSPTTDTTTGVNGQNSESPTRKPNTLQVSRRTLIWILIGLWSAVFLGALDMFILTCNCFLVGTIVATLISPIGSYFQQSHKSSYLGTSYLLSVCCFTPLYGRLSDILGRKGAMLLALTLFTSGTLFCGLAPSMDLLILARAIAGMGGGGMMTVSSITLTDLIPLKQRGLFQGLANILFGLGAGLGGPLGGWINDSIGWRWAFLFQIPFLLLSMVLVALKVNIQLPWEVQRQSTYDKLRRVDWLGSLTLVGSVGSLLLGVSLKTSEDLAWSSPIVWGLLVASVVSTSLFVFVEAKWSSAPVLPMRLLLRRTPMMVALANFFLSVTSFSMLYNVPLYFSAVRLTTSSQAGLHLLPNSIALSIGSVFAGWMMRRTGKLYVLTLASAVISVISCTLVATWNENTPTFDLWFDIIPNGFGIASLLTTTLIALIASVPREDMAVATGISYLFRTSGQVLGVSLTGALVQMILMRQLREKITGPGSQELIQRIRHETNFIAMLPPDIRKAATDSYAMALRAAFIFQVIVAFCMLLACLPIEENPLPGSHEEQDEQDRRHRERQNPRGISGSPPG
ncbi:MFS general substrate transporter [Ramaria rubella]|nr:MFS general substrate transporter [Ramaria rubella]